MNIPELVNALKVCKDTYNARLLIEQLDALVTKDRDLAPPPLPEERITLADRILPDLDHPF